MTATTETSETTAVPARRAADELAAHSSKAMNRLGAIARPRPLS